MAKIELKLSIESRSYLRQLGELENPAVINRQLVDFFTKEGQKVAGIIVKESLSGGNGLRRRTGSLARSIIGRGEVVGGLPAIRVGSLRGPALKYVAVQEYGTKGKGGLLPTIVPKGGRKNLAIPINAALTPAGVARRPGPKDWGQLKFIPFKNRKGQNAQGALYTMAEYKKIRRAMRAKTFNGLKGYKALYLLVKRVDIAPKRFLRKGFDSYLPELARNLAAFVKALLFSARGRATA